MSAGKGSKPRQGQDLEKFRENYDLIFKNKSEEEVFFVKECECEFPEDEDSTSKGQR